MADPRYRYAHQQRRDALRPFVEAGEAYCVEPVCVMATRWIAPGSQWHLSHDPSGTVTIGPSHARCNTSEAAIRGNKMRARRPVVPADPTGGRWTL